MMPKMKKKERSAISKFIKQNNAIYRPVSTKEGGNRVRYLTQGDQKYTE